MKERPILMSAPMVRATLDGSKTQTRRAVNHWKVTEKTASFWFDEEGWWEQSEAGYSSCVGESRYGSPGDYLWIKETFKENEPPSGWIYRATDELSVHRDARPWKPSIFMPRKASRITLEVESVRVERLQDISHGDAMAEGCPFPNMADGPDPRQWYRELWETINGHGSWDTNPWVWVITFKRIQP